MAVAEECLVLFREVPCVLHGRLDGCADEVRRVADAQDSAREQALLGVVTHLAQRAVYDQVLDDGLVANETLHHRFVADVPQRGAEPCAKKPQVFDHVLGVVFCEFLEGDACQHLGDAE